jgi:endonuclease YncB( thermonuclease family)
VRDPSLDSRDQYGRLLRYLVADGVDLNVELVRQGAAVPYFYRGDRGARADALMEAVDEARSARRGLWSACPEARLDTHLGSLTGRIR